MTSASKSATQSMSSSSGALGTPRVLESRCQRFKKWITPSPANQKGLCATGMVLMVIGVIFVSCTAKPPSGIHDFFSAHSGSILTYVITTVSAAALVTLAILAYKGDNHDQAKSAEQSKKTLADHAWTFGKVLGGAVLAFLVGYGLYYALASYHNFYADWQGAVTALGIVASVALFGALAYGFRRAGKLMQLTVESEPAGVHSQPAPTRRTHPLRRDHASGSGSGGGGGGGAGPDAADAMGPTPSPLTRAAGGALSDANDGTSVGPLVYANGAASAAGFAPSYGEGGGGAGPDAADAMGPTPSPLTRAAGALPESVGRIPVVAYTPPRGAVSAADAARPFGTGLTPPMPYGTTSTQPPAAPRGRGARRSLSSIAERRLPNDVTGSDSSDNDE